ncbi:HMG1/2-like protein [Curcuma longa]|uniref:HMG1/2-like protein n=1 Tax=Curcuma longa TaxID=136217 RepID=UPI003D9F5169
MRQAKAVSAASSRDATRVPRKRKGADVDGGKKAKRGKAAKDPNKPKRPPSAFFVFLEEFRKEFQQQNPDNKKVAVVSKACGDKWKSMSESEKAPYVEKAAKRKEEYQKQIAAYNQKQSEGNSGETSDKSKSEVDYEDEQEEDEE